MGHQLADALATNTRPTHVRYVVVALTTLMAVLLYLDRICLSLTERFITEELTLSNEQASWLLSAFFWTYALGQVPSGWLSDRFGARGVLAVYILAWSLFTGLMGLAYSFPTLLVYRLGCGLAQAGAYPTSAALLSKWVPLRARALASGIVATGGRIGGVLAQVLTASLMVAFTAAAFSEPVRAFVGSGWRPVMLVYGLAGMIVAGFFWLGVRDRPMEHSGCNQAELALIEEGRPPGTPPTPPSEGGDQKNSPTSESGDQKNSPTSEGGVGGVGRPRGLPLAGILRSRSLWLSSLNQLGTNVGWVFLITWFPRYLAEVHHVPLLERGWLASLPILLGIAGMLAGGWLTDVLTRRVGLRWGRALPMALTRFAGAAGFATCVLLDGPWEVTAALCLVAIATDLGVPAVWAYMQDVGGGHVGAVLGWGNMWGNLGAAVSPMVLNAVIGPGRWDACFLACAGAFIISGAAALGIDATLPIVPEAALEGGNTGRRHAGNVREAR